MKLRILLTAALAVSASAADRPAANHPDLQGIWNFATLTPLDCGPPEKSANFHSQSVIKQRWCSTRAMHA